MGLKDYRAEKEARNIHETVSKVSRAAESLARNAIGQAEMLPESHVQENTTPGYSELSTHEYTDEPEGQTIIELQSKTSQFKNFQLEEIQYIPAPEKIGGQLPQVDEALPQLLNAYRTPNGEVDPHRAVRLTAENIALTVDYGDGIGEPLVSARTIVDGQLKTPTANEIEQVFAIRAKDF